jgi:translocation and assembly module TamB
LVTGGKSIGLLIARLNCSPVRRRRAQAKESALTATGCRAWRHSELKASLARRKGDIVIIEGLQGNFGKWVSPASGRPACRWKTAAMPEPALVWDSERAGTASGQLTTRLTRCRPSRRHRRIRPENAPLSGQFKAQLPRTGVWSLLALPLVTARFAWRG